MNRKKLIALIAFILFVAIIICGCSSIKNAPEANGFKKFKRAIILQPDNTLVIGNLQDFYYFGDGNLYQLTIGDRTYLVPYTRITLISE